MDMREAAGSIAAQKETVAKIKDEMSKVVVGQEKLVDRLVLALITGGHILLEGVPGLAGKRRPRCGAKDRRDATPRGPCPLDPRQRDMSLWKPILRGASRRAVINKNMIPPT